MSGRNIRRSGVSSVLRLIGLLSGLALMICAIYYVIVGDLDMAFKAFTMGMLISIKESLESKEKP